MEMTAAYHNIRIRKSEHLGEQHKEGPYLISWMLFGKTIYLTWKIVCDYRVLDAPFGRNIYSDRENIYSDREIGCNLWRPVKTKVYNSACKDKHRSVCSKGENECSKKTDVHAVLGKNRSACIVREKKLKCMHCRKNPCDTKSCGECTIIWEPKHF